MWMWVTDEAAKDMTHSEREWEEERADMRTRLVEIPGGKALHRDETYLMHQVLAPQCCYSEQTKRDIIIARSPST
jgi:hypothetical protein